MNMGVIMLKFVPLFFIHKIYNIIKIVTATLEMFPNILFSVVDIIQNLIAVLKLKIFLLL